MIYKQTLKRLFAGLLVAGALLISFAPTVALAAGNKGCETDTAIISCANVDVDEDGVENTGLWSLLITTINILSVGVGVAAIGGIVYASILYTSAGGSQEQVKKAMGIITNVVIGVIAYALMFTGLNFLIPGGLFT